MYLFTFLIQKWSLEYAAMELHGFADEYRYVAHQNRIAGNKLYNTLSFLDHAYNTRMNILQKEIKDIRRQAKNIEIEKRANDSKIILGKYVAMAGEGTPLHWHEWFAKQRTPAISFYHPPQARQFQIEDSSNFGACTPLKIRGSNKSRPSQSTFDSSVTSTPPGGKGPLYGLQLSGRYMQPIREESFEIKGESCSKNFRSYKVIMKRRKVETPKTFGGPSISRPSFPSRYRVLPSRNTFSGVPSVTRGIR